MKAISLSFNENILPLGLSGHVSHHYMAAASIATTGKQDLEDITKEYPSHAIAVVGMACRLPGANSVDEFWELLTSGVSMVRPPPADRLDIHGMRWSKENQFWGNFIEDADAFDHRFFNRSSREAASWDPQQCVLLEVAYQALESAGHFGPGTRGATSTIDYGCFIGAATTGYYDNVACHPPNAYSLLGTSRAFFSGHLSHQFGLTGPAMSIDTACSSSLVAINAACKSIMSGECSGAVAGGTNIITSPYDYQNLAAAGFLSPTGGCKPFDALADGYCRGEGVAVVVLKPLAAALAEGNHISGVILGSAVNQNLNDAHITVPCAASQTQLYNKVLQDTGLEASEVSYVEAHGTGMFALASLHPSQTDKYWPGTQVGDPIECQSIRDVFGGSQRKSMIHVGSVKAQIGHTEASAGVAGLIKTILMMRHQTIVGQAAFKSLNLKIPALKPDMMDIPTTCQPWMTSPRVAFVNNYGASGSNAVVAVREAPTRFRNRRTGNHFHSEFKQPLFISASSEQSLSAFARRMADFLAAERAPKSRVAMLSSVLFALANCGNHTLKYSIARTVKDLDDVQRVLSEVSTGSAATQKDAFSTSRPLVIAFGGQESDHVGLPEVMYNHISILRHHLNECNSTSIELQAGSIFPAIFQPTSITRLPTLHAALFAVQYSTAKCWLDCGIKPAAVVGHSFGQYAALCIAGCLSLADTMKLVIGRARLIESSWGTERGTMLSIQADSHTISEVLTNLRRPTLEIACYNYPKGNVVVGSEDDVLALEDYLADNQTVAHKRLRVTHGFHSVFTEPILSGLKDIATEMTWKQPSIHIELCTEFSNESPLGPWLAPDHTRKPVFFTHAIERLSKRLGNCVWLEADRNTSVTSLIRNCLTSASGGQHLFCPSVMGASDSMGSLAELTVELWKAGIQVQHWPYHQSQRQEYDFISLPPYQFERNRHWVPFIERTARDYGSTHTQTVQRDQPREFIAFVGYKDNSQKEASFIIDPESERYAMLAEAHRIFGQNLAPVSLNIELPSRAALYLAPAATCDSHVTQFENLEMTSPITLDAGRDIFLAMKSVVSDGLEWSFVVSSKPKKSGNEEDIHVSGRVRLERRGDPLLDQTMARWGALIGYERCLSLLYNEEAERMHGKHIYQAVKPFFDFDEMFQGFKSVASIGKEAAARVVAIVNPQLKSNENMYDAPIILSLMKLAPILINYFLLPSQDSIRVCLRIGRIVTGSTFSIHAGEWMAYSLVTEETEKYSVADVYVFDPSTKKLVFAVLDSYFSRTPISTWQRRIQRAKVGNYQLHVPNNKPPRVLAVDATANEDPAPQKGGSRRADVYQLLHRVTDIPLEEFQDDRSLEDIGIDSLMITEVLTELNAAFPVDMNMDTILSFPSLEELATHIDSALGVKHSRPETSPESRIEMMAVAGGDTSSTPTTQSTEFPDFQDAFTMSKDSYDVFAAQTKATGFWRETYPSQARLVLACVVEAFASLGCVVADIHPGKMLPSIPHEPQHEQLVRQLFRVLEDAELATRDSEGNFIRTAIRADDRPAAAILEDIIVQYPQHANVHKLVQATGSVLGNCLTGKQDARYVIFGDKATKHLLADVYENWPLMRSATMVLGQFLETAFSASRLPGRKFRILEVGAGTAGTTKYLVRHLAQHGVPFEYVFTDLSASLVADAKHNIFAGVPDMQFRVLDIEKEPAPELVGSFDVIVSSNCIHATRNLTRSLGTLRRLLRPGGVLALVEFTRNMFWLDVVFGLFEGWWLFDDGREHAIADEARWKACMLEAGFKSVAWSGGAEPEANTLRVIAAFT